MQRIRLQTQVEAAIPVLQEKLDLLHRHFPPSIANTFAIPRKNAQGVEWWTELQGQATAYAELPVQAQQKLVIAVRERLDAIRNLQQKLHSDGRVAEADALQTLVGEPSTDQLWSIHGEPLIYGWGVTQRPVPAPVAAPPQAAPAPTVTSPPPPPVESHRRRWLFWLLPLLLLLLLLPLLWWLWGWWQSRPLAVLPVPVATAQTCSKASAEVPEFVLVLDTSGSMELNINATKAQEHMFLSMRVRGAATAEPQRMTVAKQAIEKVVSGLQPQIATHLVTFGACGAANYHGAYEKGQRSTLLRTINSLKPDGATPIAASLRKASGLVDGKKKDAVVLLFVDGEDGCNENVCQTARTIHARQPKLRVNVVNISNDPLSNCVADITGGRVYAANDVQKIAQSLADATKEIANPAGCE